MSGSGCFHLLKFEYDHQGFYGKYIPAGNIKSVRIHKTAYDYIEHGDIFKLLSKSDSNNTEKHNNRYKELRFYRALWEMILELSEGRTTKCTCDAADAIKTTYYEATQMPVEEYNKLTKILGYAGCVCVNKMPLIFPLYEVSTGTRRYMLDPAEREHMDRFLTGTDNPLYDLVHELRYNPTIGLGADKDAARADFEGKKRKKRAKVSVSKK